jgi:hypothetical protein
MLFDGFHGFLRFFTRFSTQKTFLSQRDHSHTVPLANAQLTRMPGRFLKNSSFCFIKAVKIINSAPLKIPEVLYERFKRISQKVDIGFFKRCLRRFTKGALKRQNYGSGNKEKDGKNIGVLFKPEPGKMNNHIVQ